MLTDFAMAATLDYMGVIRSRRVGLVVLAVRRQAGPRSK